MSDAALPGLHSAFSVLRSRFPGLILLLAVVGLAAGCRTANGLGMLLYQGVAALELWTGAKPPIDIMRAALKREVYGHLES